MHIDQAERGDKCNCVCSDCLEPFTAKKGKIRDNHFAHKIDTKCSGGNPETLLHRLAKKIICDNSEIALTDNKSIKYENAIAEKYFGRIKPDVSAISNALDIFFEICVTNMKAEYHKDIYKAQEKRCIEIDLRNIPYDADYEIIKQEVLFNTKNKIDIGFTENKIGDYSIVKNTLCDDIIYVGKWILAILILIKSFEILFTTRHKLNTKIY